MAFLPNVPKEVREWFGALRNANTRSIPLPENPSLPEQHQYQLPEPSPHMGVRKLLGLEEKDPLETPRLHDAWQAHLYRRRQRGEALPGSSEERAALDWIDEAREAATAHDLGMDRRPSYSGRELFASERYRS